MAKFLRFDSLLSWGKPLRNLLDHPRITPYLSNLLGEKFRLDHDYVHIIRQVSVRLALIYMEVQLPTILANITNLKMAECTMA